MESAPSSFFLSSSQALPTLKLSSFALSLLCQKESSEKERRIKYTHTRTHTHTYVRQTHSHACDVFFLYSVPEALSHCFLPSLLCSLTDFWLKKMSLFGCSSCPRRMPIAYTLFLLYLCVMGTVAASNSSSAAVPTPESETMKFLRRLVTAMPDLASYTSSTDYCMWGFVNCKSGSVVVDMKSSSMTTASTLPELADDVDGSLVLVTEFVARYKGTVLGGSLPSSWGRLTKLQRVELPGNALTGTLPSAWAALTALQFLYVDNNALMGSFPSEWRSMAALELLYVNNNTLSGSLPETWGVLPVLRSVIADFNALSGTLPASWASLTRMKVLQLDDNKMHGTLPPEWSAMAALVTLKVNNNTLTGTLPPAWNRLSKMLRLELDNNRLSGSLPASWGSLRSSITLSLTGNEFCGCVPAEWTMTKLRVDAALSATTCATTNACVADCSDSAVCSSSSTASHVDSGSSNIKFVSSNVSSSAHESSVGSSHVPPSASSSGSRARASGSDSNSGSFDCVVAHCVLCETGNSKKCSECARSYTLATPFLCTLHGDTAYRQGVSATRAWMMSALLCLLLIWNAL